ncbi:MAG: Cobalt import ATP-binding protein CbiO [Chlamydiales bacterium]|nr:Cobalt import ATP-binding protein CbiO [Chlamydiales bacterium]
MNNQAFLAIQELSYSVEGENKKILDSISIEIQKGDFIVLLGGNGSGKSSFLKCINGLYRPQKGKVLFGEKELSRLSFEKIGKQVATLTQDLAGATFGELTVLENCQCAALKQNTFCSKEKITAHLKQYHPALSSKLNQRAVELSGGERQCLALAMGLFYPPKLLLLDEHTSALDPQLAKQMMALTHAHSKQITVIMTTHNLEDALNYGNRLLLMQKGKIVFDVGLEEKEKLTKEDLLRMY